MKLLKRAQITMETIFIYGIISVVVLSGIAALIYFGVLDLGNYLPDKCTFDSGDMTCSEWLVADGDFVRIGIHNDLSKQVEVRSISLRSEDGGNLFDYGGSDQANCTCSLAPGSELQIPPKNTKAFNMSSADTDCTADCLPMSEMRGNKLKVIISMEYKPTGGAIWQRTGGELLARVQ